MENSTQMVPYIVEYFFSLVLQRGKKSWEQLEINVKYHSPNVYISFDKISYLVFLVSTFYTRLILELFFKYFYLKHCSDSIHSSPLFDTMYSIHVNKTSGINYMSVIIYCDYILVNKSNILYRISNLIITNSYFKFI